MKSSFFQELTYRLNYYALELHSSNFSVMPKTSTKLPKLGVSTTQVVKT